MKGINLLLTSVLVIVASVAAGCKDNPADAACESVNGRVEGFSAPVFEGEVLVGFRVEKATVSGVMTGTSSADFTITR